MPPVAAAYQSIEPPVAVPTKSLDAPAHTAIGVAKTTGDSVGLTVIVKALLVTVGAVAQARPLVISQVITSPFANVVVA